MTAASLDGAPGPAPGVGRRLACFVYEGVLLFGVIMATGLIYALVADQRHALVGSVGLQIVLFLTLGAYFVGFWVRRGQTLAMRTWRLRLRTRGNQPLGWLRATCRYLLSWLWFLPALAVLRWAGISSGFTATLVILLGVLIYAASARWLPQGQLLHDMLCGTRLVSTSSTGSAEGP